MYSFSNVLEAGWIKGSSSVYGLEQKILPPRAQKGCVYSHNMPAMCCAGNTGQRCCKKLTVPVTFGVMHNCGMALVPIGVLLAIEVPYLG